MHDGLLFIRIAQSATTLDHCIKFPICSRVAAHAIFPANGTVCKIAEHGEGEASFRMSGRYDIR